MRADIARWAEKFINLEIIVLAFLLPIFFLPVTTEFFEFNKLILLTIAVILGFVAWAIKAVLTGRMDTRRNPLDIPILILWTVTLVATIFSDSWALSVIGQYARWYPSLFSITVITLLYFLISWNLKRETLVWAVRGFLASSALAVLLFLPQYFGLNILGQTWSDRLTFTPLGSPTILALFIGSVSGLALRELLASKTRLITWVWTASLALTIAALALINSPIGWIALAVSILASLLTSPAEGLRRVKPYLLGTLAASLVFTAVVLIPPLFNKSTFLNQDFPKEISLDLQTSWSVAATSFRQKPFWGSGPSTFLVDFTRYKPLRFNQTDFWTLRFEKPLSEYLRSFAEEGLLGVFSWIILIAAFFRTAIRNRGSWVLMPVAAATLASLFVTNATIVSAFVLFLTLASSSIDEPKDTQFTTNAKTTALLLAVLFLGTLGFLWTYRAYSAEVMHRRSLTSQNAQQVYDLQTRATQRFPWRAEYHLSLSQTSFILANQIATTEDPTEEDQENIKILVAQSISSARRATELFPLNAGNWESLAQIYRSLIGLAKDAENWAADSYQKAIASDLFNPLLRISFGGLYYQLGQYDQAADQFRASVNLKPDYANAHYNLGRTYKELGKTDLAIQELEQALKLTNPEAEGYEEAQQILEELETEQGE